MFQDLTVDTDGVLPKNTARKTDQLTILLDMLTVPWFGMTFERGRKLNFFR
jgi:hypothetical protein